jgi:uncharacterized delta-60 repeat protein
VGRLGSAARGAVVALAALALWLPATAAAAPGDLDPSFAEDGFLSLDVGWGPNEAFDVVEQPDGRLLVAGGDADIAVSRYLPTGALDRTFAEDGRLRTSFGDREQARAIVLQPDGKIVVVTTGWLVRYRPGGALDPTFSGDGRQAIDFGGVYTEAVDVALGPGGKLVVAGTSRVAIGAEYEFMVARFSANGAPDTTFSGDGLAAADFPGDARAQALVVQPDGRPVVVGSRFTNGQHDYALARWTAGGAPDPTFSGDGVHTTHFGGNELATDVALAADGKLMVAGSVEGRPLVRYRADGSLDPFFEGLADHLQDPSGVAVQDDGAILVSGRIAQDFAVLRFTPGGVLDSTWSGDGFKISNFGGNERANAVAALDDGDVVAVGVTDYPPGLARFAIARFESDGDHDATFGGDGRRAVTHGGGDNAANAVAIQPDGKIVVAGFATELDGTRAFAVARFHPDGSRDRTFGYAGHRVTDLGGPNDEAFGVAVQPDGRILLVGTGGPGADFALARYTADGFLDPTFSGDGKQLTAFGGTLAFPDFASDVALRPDGRIVVVGTAFAGARNLTTARYLPDGSLDPAFGTGGVVHTLYSSRAWASGYGVALQPDGKVVASGDSGGYFLAVRHLPDGAPDNTFSGDGKTLIGPGGEARDVIVQPDGKIVLIGATGSDFLVARLTPAGAPDTTFSGDGHVTTDLAGSSDFAYGGVLQADGKIVVAGRGGRSASDDTGVALARYKPGGSLDLGFGEAGMVVSPPEGSEDDAAHGIAMDAQGRFVVAGHDGDTFNSRNAVVARYEGGEPAP